MTAIHRRRLYVDQRVTVLVNRYDVREAAPDGSPGRLLAFAEQKRFALKEQVTFWSDDSRSRAVFGFRARRVLDVRSGYDVTDEQGAPLAFLRKELGASLLRSTFHLQGPGYDGMGQERNAGVALLRRFSDVQFLPVHFDYVGGAGEPLLSVTRRARIRDRYTVDVPDPRVDWRVAAAVGVAMDALLGR